MGHILSNYINSNVNSETQLVIDFEDAKPKGEEERKLYDENNKIISKCPAILEKLSGYKGCADSIRKAITTPTPESEAEAFDAVLPCVETLREFYEYSIELEHCIPKLLTGLCKEKGQSQLADQQALVKQLADLFNFILRFDELKMINPAIQNDFSYYRRSLTRAKKMAELMSRIVVKDELANKMSLFYAYPTPMMKCLSETTSKFLAAKDGIPKENVHNVLAGITDICYNMVEKKRLQNDQTNLLCLRTMTAAIVLYDHIHPAGAFHKGSLIHIKNCITLLKNHRPPPPESLINALRFTTVHLNDDSTPSSIKQLLA